MKKLLTMAIALTLGLSALFVLTGCDGGKTSAKDVEFLTKADYWYCWDEVTGETEKMNFREDFTFYWGCECGEPVGASDCYELFDYDKETGMIHLYNGYDDMTMDMEVLDYSDYHLLLKIDGEIKDYTHVDYEYEVPNSEKYLSGYTMAAYIPEGDMDGAVLTHYGYDGDVDYPENVKKTYPFAEDAEFYDLQVNVLYKDGLIAKDETTYRELTREEAVDAMTSTSGFIWLNDNLEITKMTYYGAIINEE